MDEPEVLLFGGGKWLRVSWADRPYRVLARVEERDGRRVIVDLVVRSREHVDSGTLKGLPIGWLEGVANAPEAREHLNESNTDTDRMSLVLAELELVIDEMTAKPAERFMGAEVKRQPLQRPDGRDPDFFYRQVAEAYMDVLRKTSAIAPVLAEEAGVPVATARRWVQEARRRGFLPPARQGRAG
ncbi:hypothetical protein [Streptomyces cucumeris]|uniref:hypothetical protein n=1 Tax=Streptomyces cucumeris TaxID=2962890 RepID=UPI0020C8D061|nr:hypothetical protein [Streptomyces sp. NEAU-Y11]MCP9209954.1 hypothetical protein [Streptomyces sp. NEAU-Y11]